MKAFDSIPYQHLLLKLKGYGIAKWCMGYLHRWIGNFLVNHQRRVIAIINGHEIEWCTALSGVPH